MWLVVSREQLITQSFDFAQACSERVESNGEQTCLERPVVSKVEPSRKSRTINHSPINYLTN
jgi:hypothetical protein